MIKHSAAAGLALALVAGSALRRPCCAAAALHLDGPLWRRQHRLWLRQWRSGSGRLVLLATNLPPMLRRLHYAQPRGPGLVDQQRSERRAGRRTGRLQLSVQSRGSSSASRRTSRRPTCTAKGTAMARASDVLGPHISLRHAEQERRLVRHGARTHRRDLPEPAEPAGLRHGRSRLWRRGAQLQRVGLLFVVPWRRPLAVLGAGTNYDQTKVGWTAGGGVEWFPLIASPLFSAFSVKLEYLYTDLGATTLYGSSIGSIPTGGPAFAYQHTSQTRWNTVRLGVNWHFDPFAAGPLLVIR